MSEANHAVLAGSANPLHLVKGLVRLSDGLAVFNGSSLELLIADQGGDLIQSWGRDGDGPGEFRRVFGLHSCRGDTIIVDQRFSLEVFSATSGFLRRIQAPGRTLPRLTGVFDDCGYLGEGKRVPPPLGDRGILTQTVLLLDRDLSPGDTVAVLETPGAWTRVNPAGGPLVTRLPPWIPVHAVAASGSEIAVGYGGTPEIRFYDRKGALTRIARWRAARNRIERADVELYEEKRQNLFERAGRTDEAGLLFPALREWGDALPQEKPVFDRIVLAHDGEVWILNNPGTLQGYESFPPVEETPAQIWTVLDREGSWIGEVPMPEGFELSVVKPGRAWGVHQDTIGVESVRGYRIVRAAPRDDP